MEIAGPTASFSLWRSALTWTSIALSPVAAAALLAFSLLYTPCVAAIAAIKRELGIKWAVGVVIWQCAVAWVMALIVKLIVGIFV